jgi:ribosome maturation factor RimP
MLEAALKGLHYELVDLEFPRGGIIRVFIDKPGGISVEDCVKVSNHLTHLFNVENVDYQNLEVSSPGLDRPLKKAEDYQRFKGEQAKIQLRVAIDPLENRRRFMGKIVGIENDVVQLEVEGETFAFPLSLIDKARLEPKF